MLSFFCWYKSTPVQSERRMGVGRGPRGSLQLGESASGSDLGRPGSTWAVLAGRLPSRFSLSSHSPAWALRRKAGPPAWPSSSFPRRAPERSSEDSRARCWEEQTWRSRAAAAEVSSPLPPRPQRYEATSSACRRGTWCAGRAGSPCSGFPLMERNNSSPTMACRP